MTPQDLIAVTAAQFGVSVDDLIGPCGTAHLNAARQAAIYLLRTRLRTLSLREIINLVGRSHHTTAIHALRRHEERMQQDSWYADQIYALLNV